MQSYTVRVNPLDHRKIYVGSWSNQLFRSDDGGASWYMVETGSLSATVYLSSLHIPTADTSIMLVGGYRFAGIKRTTNSGDTFQVVLVDRNLRSMWFISEAITEASNGHLFAARGATFNSIWKSTDMGATWDSVGAISKDETERLCTISAHPTDPNLLFVGAKRGRIYRSVDAGQNWTKVPVLRGMDSIKYDSEIPKIVFSPINPDRGYAVVTPSSDTAYRDNGGVLMTTDRGMTWDRIAFADTGMWAVSVRDLGTGMDEVTVGGFRISRLSNVLKGDSLVYRSTDNGATWSRYTNIAWPRENDVGDSIRNVWSLFEGYGSKKLYMATEMGTFVLDDVTSVNDQEASEVGLTVHQRAHELHVLDQSPRLTDRQWTLYSMQAIPVATGAILEPELNIDVHNLASGRYLLVWGCDTQFRTVPVTVVR